LNGGATRVTYLSAQEKTAQEGARLQKEDEDRKRKKGFKKKKTKGQESFNCIKTIHLVFSFSLLP
jgi:hypothetical protein